MSARSRRQRIGVLLVTIVFSVVVVATTVVSVGRYCLTSDGGKTTALPRR